MKRHLIKKRAFWLFSAGISAALFFFAASGSIQSAQTISLPETAALRTEEEARASGRVWSEPAVRQSSELFQKAAQQWENQNDFSNSARCLRESARLKLMLAETGAVNGLLEKSLSLERKRRNLEGRAESLYHLTIASLKLGDNKKGKFYLDQLWQLAKQIQKTQLLARAFFASGSYFYNERNFLGMLAEYEKALPLFQEAGDKTGEAETLIELAYSHIINNDRIRGRDSAQKAVEVARTAGNQRQMAFALIVLGDAYQRMGEWEPAIKSFAEAESIFPDQVDFFEKAILYNRLAFYHLAFNDLTLAKTYFQKSFALFDRIGNSEGRSELLTELGQISIREGDFDEAMRYFTQSREIAVKADDPITLGVLELKIGETHFKRGDLPAAEKSFLNALKFYEMIGIDYRTAEVHEKLGLIYEKQKNYAAAREKYLLALNLNQKVLSKFALAQNFFNLARLDARENRDQKALELIKESIKLTESSQNETANSQLKRSFIAKVFDRYELYINLLMKLHRQNPNGIFAIEALQAAEKSRARVMLENLSLSEANFIKDADAETVRRENEIRARLNAKANELTDLLSQNVAPREADEVTREISQLEHELEEIKARLKQNSPVYSAIKNPSPFDVGEFQQNILDENTLLLEFSLGEDESYLWLIGKNVINSFVLPPRVQIESRVETLRAALREREIKTGESIENFQARIRAADEVFRREAGILSRELFGQIPGTLGDKRLVVVPDGKLHYFPIAALPRPNAHSDEPFLLTNEIVYEPSAQSLSLMAKSKNRSGPASKNLLVFSDPVFTSDDARLTAENRAAAANLTAAKETFRFAESLNSLPRLLASKDETESILGIVGASNADVFSGFEANRERLLSIEANNYKIIHFATHGLVNEERPELSGIVLSRFDENGRKLDESFRIHDIYGLNLNADLVVLSACETGVGKEVKGEGLLSLNNAFLQVGAKSVLASLWKVEDGATHELMKNFYASIKEENLTPSQALRAAQIKLRQNPQYQSPFYWAAFTVQGDFNNKTEITREFEFWPYALLLLTFAVIGFYFFKKTKLFYRKVVNHS